MAYAEGSVWRINPWAGSFEKEPEKPVHIRTKEHSYDSRYEDSRQTKSSRSPHSSYLTRDERSLQVGMFSKVQKGPSALEQMYAGRIVDELEQFGYDLFGVPQEETKARLDHAASNAPLMPMGAVQDDFILNSGDEIEIMFSGQRNDRETYRVNSKGLILIKDFPPIPAAGRSMAQLRLSIETAAHNLHNTQAYISLTSVRQINVLVVGHVKQPGRKTLTVFHTTLDALMESGGVEKTGSLRQIKLVRGGRSTIIDLYGLLMHGASTMDLQLKDGDRIIVPSIGPTVAVAGEVKRPGIYETLPSMHGMFHKPAQRAEYLSLNDMLAFSGGVLAPGQNRYLKLSITAQGQERVDEIHKPFEPVFGDAAILMVSKGEAKRAGQIEIEGHARRPGMYALSENKTLKALLDSEDLLGRDIYPLIGVIERWDDEQFARGLFSFPLRLVLKGEYDQKLEDGDVVHLFSNEQMRELSLRTDKEFAERIRAVGSRPDNPDNMPDNIDEALYIEDEALASFLRERFAFIRGAVRYPGAYPVAQGVTLDSLLAVAGGLTLEASTTNIEVTSVLQGQGDQSGGRSGTHRISVNFRETSPKTVPIGSGDAVRVNQKFSRVEDKSVLIMGEVKNPGRYDLIPGDKVSNLLERAGGLSESSYPEGAIFSRESERRAEETRFRNQARGIKRAIAAALEADSDDVNAGKIAESRALAQELEEAQGLGRITIEADLAILKAQPELDMLLESGDRLYIPKRALTVRVSGEVLSPASLQFRENKKPLDYIHEAGSFTFHADKERTFVLYPDGSAQPLQVSAWNYNPVFIPPGSTIVVPRDPKPFDFIESAKDISQILSNLAITAIFIDDVRE